MQEGAQGERTWVTLYDVDGVGHQSRLKTDITSREAELGVLFLVTEPGRWPSLPPLGADSIIIELIFLSLRVSRGVWFPNFRMENYSEGFILPIIHWKIWGDGGSDSERKNSVHDA